MSNPTAFPVFEEEPTVLVFMHDVTHVQPPVLAFLRRRVRIAKIFELERRSVRRPEEQFARHPGCAVAAVVVDYAMPERGHRPANTTTGLTVSPPSAAP